MVDLVTLILKPDAFEKIYKEIPYRLNKDIDKRKLHEDLYHILMGVGQKDWVYDFEYGPTALKRTELISGFAYNIEQLMERYKIIEKHYPKYKCPETGKEEWPLPKWLSEFTDEFDHDELRVISEKLRGFEERCKKFTENGARPRLSGRRYYIEELIKVFEEHTAAQATVNKTDPTDFSCFVRAFFEHAPIHLKNRDIGCSALYNEFQKIKKNETSS
jgi:hypothetical protein